VAADRVRQGSSCLQALLLLLLLLLRVRVRDVLPY
jgi:hypothetical protein